EKQRNLSKNEKETEKNNTKQEEKEEKEETQEIGVNSSEEDNTQRETEKHSGNKCRTVILDNHKNPEVTGFLSSSLERTTPTKESISCKNLLSLQHRKRKERTEQ